MTFKKGKKLFLLMVGLSFTLLCVHINNGVVYAVPNVNIQKQIMDKAIYQGVYKCYITAGMLKPTMGLGSYHDMGSLMGENAAHGDYIDLVSGGHDGLMGQLISQGRLRYNEGNDSLSCRQLFVGWGNNQGLLAAFGKSLPSSGNTENVKRFFNDMGYDVTQVSGDGSTCYSVRFNRAINGNTVSMESSNKICQRADGDLYSEPAISSSTGGIDGNIVFETSSSGNVCLRFKTANDDELRCGQLVDSNGNSASTLDQSTLVETIKKNVCNYRPGMCVFADSAAGGSSAIYKLDDISGHITEQDYLGGYVASFPGYPQHGSSVVAARRALNYLSDGNQTDEGLGLSNAEKRVLYQEYLTQYYDYGIDCANEHVGAESIPWFNDGAIKECFIVTEGSNSTEKVHGVDDAGMFGVDVDAGEIINYLKSNKDYTEDELAEMGAVASSDREDDVKDDCRNSNAGNSLGWILCPILELAGSAVDGIYNKLIEPKLGVDPKLFSSESASGEQIPYFAWQQFRDIANMIFVVLLLVVLFSQLTGVGIDNYGIKRVLPKLIISAVLINLSYLICVLVIDVSNIVGNGAAALFDNLGRNLPTTINLSTDSGAVGVTDAAARSLVTVGLAAGMATMVGSIWTPLILVTLLPTILSALIAFLFLFLLLSARQAAVVVLVVLSPLAVACNILPNTKSFFDKYLKAFKLLILVYPIVSVLISGGDYVSKLLLQIGGDSDDNFFLALTSMMVGIAPIFFIPSLIKDSFAALGKVGATISGLGRVAGNKAAGALRGSEGFKDLQRMGTEQRARKLAGVGADGKIKQLGTLGTIMRGGRRRVSEARSQYMSDQANEAARGELLSDDLFAKRLESAEEARSLRASREMYENMDKAGLISESGSMDKWLGEKGGQQRAAALMEAMVNKGMQDKVYNMLERHNFSKSSSVMNSLAGSSDKILKAYGKKANGTGTSFGSFMDGTGRGADGETITLKKYAEEKGASFLSGLDDKALKRIGSSSTSNNQIMSTQQLLGAAKTLDSDDALAQVKAMLGTRNDISFSAADYFNYDESIKAVIQQKYNENDASVMNSIQATIEAMGNDPALGSRMSKSDAAFFGSINSSGAGGGGANQPHTVSDGNSNNPWGGLEGYDG